MENKFEQFKKSAQENLDNSINWLKEHPLKSVGAMWVGFTIWLQGLSGSAVVSLLFGLGGSIAGFSLAFGLALLPGLGFILGLLVGINLTDQQKLDLAENFKNSPEWIKSNVIKLTEGIQSVWDKVIEALNKDFKKWEKDSENIEKAGENLSSLINSEPSEDSEETKED